LREVTEIARDAAANGATAANLQENPTTNTAISNEAELNTIVNSNRLFINSIAAITDLDC